MSEYLTIRQIAALAGVSRTTVSMALRNHPRISASTRRKVLRIAQKHNYRPDSLVSTLMTKLRTSRKQRGSEKLAYLTFWPDGPEVWKVNVNEANYFIGASERALQLGYELENFWASEPGIDSMRLSKILYARGIRGVVLAPLPRAIGHASLDWSRFACAAIGLTIVKSTLHRSTHGYQEGMTLALRNLRHRGYKRIGFANSFTYDQRVNHGWLSGFLTYQYRVPANCQIPPLLVDGWSEHQAYQWVQENGLPAKDKKWHRAEFARWLAKWKPDAIVSNTDHAYILAKDLGYRIPEDIGFVQLHRLLDTDPWAGVDRLPRLIGAAATDLLSQQLQTYEVGLPKNPKNVIINGVWRDGPSIRGTNSAAPQMEPEAKVSS